MAAQHCDLSAISLASADPVYKAIESKRTDLNARLVETRKLLAPLEEELRRRDAAPEAADGPAQIEPPGVRAILTEAGVGVREPPIEPIEHYNRLRREVKDLEGAIGVLARRLENGRAAASAKVCDQVRGEFRRRARAFGEALIALGRASADYCELADKLNEERVFWSQLGPVAVRGPFGVPTDPNSRLRILLKELIRDGHLRPADLPAEWR